MARAKRLQKLLAEDRRTSDRTQRSLLKAEDALSALEDRESRRRARDRELQSETTRRLPATGGGR